jgi:hypothetical protein
MPRGGGETREQATAAARAHLAPAVLAFRWVFLAYLAAASGFGRAFARLHVSVAGLPLFAGELAIALLAALGAACLWRTRAREVRRDRAVLAVLVFLAVGGAYTVVGLTRGFGIAALRDSALVYYSMFFLFTVLFLRFRGGPGLLVAAVVAGASAGAAWRVGRFLVAPELEWGHAAPGFQAIAAWVAVLGAVAPGMGPAKRHGRIARVLAVACCGVVVFLSAQRSVLAAIVAVAAGAACLRAAHRRAPLRRVCAAALAGLALWLALTVSITIHGRPIAAGVPPNGSVSVVGALRVVCARWTDLGLAGAGAGGRPPGKPARSGSPAAGSAEGTRPESPAAGAGSTTKSFTFRVAAWRRALSRIASSPLLGIGFGPSPNLFPDRHCALVTSPTSNCGNAHNTYLTLAMRMGIPILAAFLLANLLAATRAVRALAVAYEPETEWLVVFSLAALLSLGVYAGLGLFLESPYLSSLYWVILGLIHGTTARAAAAAAERQAPAQAAQPSP